MASRPRSSACKDAISVRPEGQRGEGNHALLTYVDPPPRQTPCPSSPVQKILHLMVPTFPSHLALQQGHVVLGKAIAQLAEYRCHSGFGYSELAPFEVCPDEWTYLPAPASCSQNPQAVRMAPKPDSVPSTKTPRTTTLPRLGASQPPPSQPSGRDVQLTMASSILDGVVVVGSSSGSVSTVGIGEMGIEGKAVT